MSIGFLRKEGKFTILLSRHTSLRDRQQDSPQFLCESCEEEQYTYDRPIHYNGRLICRTCAKKEGYQEEERMTLRELSPQYRNQAQILHSRIKELQQLQKEATTATSRERLQNRIRALSELYREARDLATLTERYYERGYKRNGRYTL